MVGEGFAHAPLEMANVEAVALQVEAEATLAEQHIPVLEHWALLAKHAYTAVSPS